MSKRQQRERQKRQNQKKNQQVVAKKNSSPKTAAVVLIILFSLSMFVFALSSLKGLYGAYRKELFNVQKSAFDSKSRLITGSPELEFRQGEKQQEDGN